MDEVTLSIRLVVAVILSGLIGLDRERNNHSAGLRTHMLVGLGSALFTELSIVAFPGAAVDRVAAQIVTGIGFLGAGAIVHRSDSHTQGLTTAAGIWAVAAVGMACGTGMLILAVVSTVLVLAILIIVRYIEGRNIREKRSKAGQTS